LLDEFFAWLVHELLLENSGISDLLSTAAAGTGAAGAAERPRLSPSCLLLPFFRCRATPAPALR
jgi:hypothetical protein